MRKCLFLWLTVYHLSFWGEIFHFSIYNISKFSPRSTEALGADSKITRSLLFLLFMMLCDLKAWTSAMVLWINWNTKVGSFFHFPILSWFCSAEFISLSFHVAWERLWIISCHYPRDEAAIRFFLPPPIKQVLGTLLQTSDRDNYGKLNVPKKTLQPLTLCLYQSVKDSNPYRITDFGRIGAYLSVFFWLP